MQIIEYNVKYLNDVRDLLLELEEYIVSIDQDNLDRVHQEYWEKMALVDLEEVNKHNGKCYLAIEKDKAIGLIMGIIPDYDEFDYLDYKCPKRGIITELIVTNVHEFKKMVSIRINNRLPLNDIVMDVLIVPFSDVNQFREKFLEVI